MKKITGLSLTSILLYASFISMPFYAEETSDTDTVEKDPVENYWIATNQFTGTYLCGWQMYVKDGILYGKILSATKATPETISKRCHKTYKDFPVSGDVSKLIMFGKPWIYGLHKKDIGKWYGGYIINPDSGAYYLCDITYHEADGRRFKRATLEMHGSIPVLHIGLSQYWPCGTKEEAEGIK